MSDTPPYSEATRAYVEEKIRMLCGDGKVPDGAEVAARVVLNGLARRGRLLPEGAETRTEWAVWWLGPGGGIRLSQEHLTSRTEAEQMAPERIGKYGIVRWELRYREHRDFADGSCLSGPWSAVPPEPTGDVPE